MNKFRLIAGAMIAASLAAGSATAQSRGGTGTDARGIAVVSAPATQLVRESTIAARSAANNERRAGGGASFIAPTRSPTPNPTSPPAAPRSTWHELNPDAIPHHRPQINYAEPAPGAAHPHSGPTAQPVGKGGAHPGGERSGGPHASPVHSGGARK